MFRKLLCNQRKFREPVVMLRLTNGLLRVRRCARFCQKCWAHKPRQCETCVPGYHLDSRGQCAGEPTLNRFPLIGCCVLL